MILDVREIARHHAIGERVDRLVRADLVRHAHEEDVAVHRLLLLPIISLPSSHLHQLLHPSTLLLVSFPTNQGGKAIGPILHLTLTAAVVRVTTLATRHQLRILLQAVLTHKGLLVVRYRKRQRVARHNGRSYRV